MTHYITYNIYFYYLCCVEQIDPEIDQGPWGVGIRLVVNVYVFMTQKADVDLYFFPD